MTRRTSSGNARNGITCSQAFSQAWVITGNRCPHFSSKASSSSWAWVGVGGGVDRLQIAGDLLALTARHVLQGSANQVNNACLHRGLREDRLDRLREAAEAVDAADQYVAHAAGLEVVEYLHPELRALGL